MKEYLGIDELVRNDPTLPNKLFGENTKASIDTERVVFSGHSYGGLTVIKATDQAKV